MLTVTDVVGPSLVGRAEQIDPQDGEPVGIAQRLEPRTDRTTDAIDHCIQRAPKGCGFRQPQSDRVTVVA